MNLENKKFKIYLLFCVVMFFVLLLIILSYSFGYRYDFRDGKTIQTIQTGAVIIKTYPKDTRIYINGKYFKVNRTMGELFNDYIKIERLNPGTYNIKIEKDNYLNWEKNIKVRSGYVTEVKNIVLLKSNYKKNTLLSNLDTASNLNNLWVNNEKNRLIYKKTNKGKLSLYIFDLKNKTQEILVNSDDLPLKKIDGSHDFDNIIWSDDDIRIILKISNSENSFWRLIDLESKKTYDLSAIFIKDQEIESGWNLYFNGSSLFYLKDDALYKFDYQALLSKKILENVSGFRIKDNNIYYLKTTDNNLHLSNYSDLSSSRIMFTMPDDFDSKPLSSIIKSSKNTFLILSDLGKLYFMDENGKATLINSPVKNAYFSNNDTRIVYYNDHEIWVYYIKEKISQPPKKEFTNELITRYSGNISNVFLYRDEEHLFYKEGSVLKFAELDDRDNRNIFDLLKLDNNNVFYSNSDNSLFYKQDDKLAQIKLDE